MNAESCKREAIKMARVGIGQFADAEVAADAWLKPYADRDATVVDGKMLVDEVDQETFEHRTVEHQMHAPRRVRPYMFGVADVRSLANHIRRELRLA